MKISHVLSVIVTLLIAIGLVLWLSSSAPTLVESSDSDSSSEATQHDGKKLDYSRSNPFDLKHPGPHPVAEISEDVYSFGVMESGTSGEHDFVIRNAGTVPLKIAKGPSQCKCTLSELEADEIAPGEEAIVHLTWTPKTVGPFGQEATIWTNDPENSKIQLRVEGMMRIGIMRSPDGAWLLGKVSEDEEATFDGAIYSKVYDHFEITGIETSDERVQVTTAKMDASDLVKHQAISGYLIHGTFHPDGVAGKIRESVIVRTDNENHPEFRFEVTGTQPGPIQLVGPGWYSGPKLMDLGIIKQSAGTSAKFAVLVDRFEGDFEILDIQTIPEYVQAEIIPQESPEDAESDRFELSVEVPAGSPVGDWNAAHYASITVKTNHPKDPEYVIAVEMDIRRIDHDVMNRGPDT